MSRARKRTAKGASKSLTPPDRGARGFILVALLVSLFLLLAGLLTPAMHISSFGFVEDDVSILSGIESFYLDGQIFLAGLMVLVSVFFPLLKIVLALMLTLSYNAGRRRSHWIAATLAELARWSMTDVFILAVAVMVIDARLISSADLRPGAYFFAIAIILSSVAVHFLRAGLRRRVRINSL